MENTAQKNILFLSAAGLVLVVVNMAVFMGSRTGQIAPVDNLMLWGAFTVLSVCSLLWAVSLLGLQPMLVAISYTAGGFMAFLGVRLIPNVNVAEIATAGATYGAVGALVVGNATTRVRSVFFSKRQVPVVFMIIALLLVDGLLNSRVSTAGWNVIAGALIFPFVLSGIVIGLVWMVVARSHAGQGRTKKAPAALEEAAPIMAAAADDDEAAQLMFSVPESTKVDDTLEAVALAPNPEPTMENVSEAPTVEMESPDVVPMEDESVSDNFFPLEIDKGEETIQREASPDLMDVAARVAENAPELAMEADPVAENMDTLSEEFPVLESNPDPVGEPISEASSVLEFDPEPVEEPGEPASEEKKVESSDWLSGHLDLLNKLS